MRALWRPAADDEVFKRTSVDYLQQQELESIELEIEQRRQTIQMLRARGVTPNDDDLDAEDNDDANDPIINALRDQYARTRQKR